MPLPHPRPAPALLVAVAGGSGSGKTWLARTLRRRIGRHAALLSLDDFYRDLAHLAPASRRRVNFDDPSALDWELLEGCLRDIRAGRPVRLPRYDFATHTRLPGTRRWRPRPVVFVEGLWPWVRPRLRRLYALRLFREAPTEVRRGRREDRDTRERGRTRASVLLQWRRQVEPMHILHVQPQRDQAHRVLGPDLRPDELTRLAREITARAALPRPIP